MVALLEYQAKALLSGTGIQVPRGSVVGDARASAAAIAGSSSWQWMVKAQVPMKNRAAHAGVRPASRDKLPGVVEALLGTTVDGHVVRRVLVEEALDVAAEWFLSVIVDPWGGGLTLRGSDSGGSGVEERLAAGAGLPPLPFSALAPPSAHDVLAAWSATADPVTAQVAAVAAALCALAVDNDLLLVEINPLAVTGDGDLVALDAHVEADEAADFRQQWRRAADADLDLVHPGRAWRRQYGADFKVLDPEGEVALLSTGAGGSMLLIDELTERGVRCYNFADIRAGTPWRRRERFQAAAEMIRAGTCVRAVLISVHAGVTDLREVTPVLVETARSLTGHGLGVVVRLQGPHAVEASVALERATGALVEPSLPRALAAAADLAGNHR